MRYRLSEKAEQRTRSPRGHRAAPDILRMPARKLLAGRPGGRHRTQSRGEPLIRAPPNKKQKGSRERALVIKHSGAQLRGRSPANRGADDFPKSPPLLESTCALLPGVLGDGDAAEARKLAATSKQDVKLEKTAAAIPPSPQTPGFLYFSTRSDKKRLRGEGSLTVAGKKRVVGAKMGKNCFLVGVLEMGKAGVKTSPTRLRIEQISAANALAGRHRFGARAQPCADLSPPTAGDRTAEPGAPSSADGARSARQIPAPIPVHSLGPKRRRLKTYDGAKWSWQPGPFPEAAHVLGCSRPSIRLAGAHVLAGAVQHPETGAMINELRRPPAQSFRARPGRTHLVQLHVRTSVVPRAAREAPICRAGIGAQVHRDCSVEYADATGVCCTP
ncbi:hypothetical protein MRX96_005131 [Rhipicephalus microplus]